MLCESCNSVFPTSDRCLNPECIEFIAPEKPEPKGPVCSCGEMYEGRPCAPDCEMERYYEDQRDAERHNEE